jgi:hypothetical protein
VIHLVFDQQQVDGGLVFDVAVAIDVTLPTVPGARFPLAGRIRTFPLKAARAYPLAGKLRTYS